MSKEKTKGKKDVYKGQRPVSTEKTKGKEGGSKGKRPLRYPCDLCSKVYNRQCDLRAHAESEHSTGKPLVPYSDSESDTESPTKRTKNDCSYCGIKFSHNPTYIKHRKKHHQEGLGVVEEKTKQYYTLPDGYVDEALKQLYRNKFHHIMVPHMFSPAHADYSFSKAERKHQLQRNRGIALWNSEAGATQF